MIKIVFEKENNRSVAYDNDIEVGECTFVEEGDVWNINHTGVDETHRGQGIAKRLVESITEEAQKQNKTVRAQCSFAAKKMTERNDEKEDTR